MRAGGTRGTRSCGCGGLGARLSSGTVTAWTESKLEIQVCFLIVWGLGPGLALRERPGAYAAGILAARWRPGGFAAGGGMRALSERFFMSISDGRPAAPCIMASPLAAAI